MFPSGSNSISGSNLCLPPSMGYDGSAPCPADRPPPPSTLRRHDSLSAPAQPLTMATDLRLPTHKIVQPGQRPVSQRRESVRSHDVALRPGGRVARSRAWDLQGAPQPGEADDRVDPGPDGQWQRGGVHGLPGAVQHVARAGEGRDPVRPAGDAGGSQSARRVDDLEVRGRQHSRSAAPRAAWSATRSR